MADRPAEIADHVTGVDRHLVGQAKGECVLSTRCGPWPPSAFGKAACMDPMGIPEIPHLQRDYAIT
jgi:hypothetical protein